MNDQSAACCSRMIPLVALLFVFIPAHSSCERMRPHLSANTFVEYLDMPIGKAGVLHVSRTAELKFRPRLFKCLKTCFACGGTIYKKILFVHGYIDS